MFINIQHSTFNIQRPGEHPTPNIERPRMILGCRSMLTSSFMGPTRVKLTWPLSMNRARGNSPLRDAYYERVPEGRGTPSPRVHGPNARRKTWLVPHEPYFPLTAASRPFM